MSQSELTVMEVATLLQMVHVSICAPTLTVRDEVNLTHPNDTHHMAVSLTLATLVMHHTDFRVMNMHESTEVPMTGIIEISEHPDIFLIPRVVTLAVLQEHVMLTTVVSEQMVIQIHVLSDLMTL